MCTFSEGTRHRWEQILYFCPSQLVLLNAYGCFLVMPLCLVNIDLPSQPLVFQSGERGVEQLMNQHCCLSTLQNLSAWRNRSYSYLELTKG